MIRDTNNSSKKYVRSLLLWNEMDLFVLARNKEHFGTLGRLYIFRVPYLVMSE